MGTPFSSRNTWWKPGAPVALDRVRSITEAKPLLPAAACVLLDLDLPDAGTQLQGVHWLTRRTCPRSPWSC